MQLARRLFVRASLVTAIAIIAPSRLLAGADIHVHDPWTRPGIPNRPAAIYMLIHNHGDTDDRLIGASSPRARKIELHKSEMKNGMMTMTPVEGIDVPAEEAVELKPRGYHMMAFGITPPLKVGESLPLVLRFEKAGTVEVQVPVLRKPPEGVDDTMHMQMPAGSAGGQGAGTGN